MPRNARASALPKMRDLRARYRNGSVPIEAVGLKLFTGIENFEIMAYGGLGIGRDGLRAFRRSRSLRSRSGRG
jgi:hypothetical protein